MRHRYLVIHPKGDIRWTEIDRTMPYSQAVTMTRAGYKILKMDDHHPAPLLFSTEEGGFIAIEMSDETKCFRKDGKCVDPEWQTR